MRTALAWARQGYDFVLLDSAPALPVTDAVVLAREADGVLFVIKGQDTPRELVRRGRDQLQGVGSHFLGVVVNNVDYRSSDYYTYSSYYYGTPGDPAPPADPGVQERI
jgi:Mrp family chromosome partitioning ATPase